VLWLFKKVGSSCRCERRNKNQGVSLDLLYHIEKIPPRGFGSKGEETGVLNLWPENGVKSLHQRGEIVGKKESAFSLISRER